MPLSYKVQVFVECQVLRGYWDPHSSPHDCARAIQLVSHRPSQHIFLKSIQVHRQVMSLPAFLLQALTDTLLCTTLAPTPEKC